MKVNIDLTTGKIECEVGDFGALHSAIKEAVEEWINYELGRQVKEIVAGWVKEETLKQRDLLIERLKPEIVKQLGDVRISRGGY